MSEWIKLPIWKSCLDHLRETGLTYGMKWKSDFFEKELRCARGSDQFAFEMLALKQALEDEDGYYLRQSENGETWEIPPAAEHEDVSQLFERKMRRYAARAITLRNSTLMNQKADLTPAERGRMESNLERASVRLLLLSRQKSIERIVKQNKPKLLDK